MRSYQTVYFIFLLFLSENLEVLFEKMHIYKCLHEQVEDVAQNEREILNREEREQRAELESRARTHLANERTFLAWLRTGIALISLGLAAAQFLEHQVIPGLPLIRGMSIIMVVTGILMAVDGTRRYIRHSKQIEAGAFSGHHPIR
jgi:putative membrane protein